MIIAAKSDYIEKANSAYINLINYEEVFEIETQVIDYVKCALLRNDELDDFYIDNYLVSVYHNGNEYDLYFANYEMEIEVYDKQIVGMSMQAL